MKERIVITQDWLVKDMKAGVPELDKLFICQKVEQEPENFADLKKLCKDIKGIRFGYLGETKETEYISLDNKIYFCVDGTIDFGFENLAYTITPAQMWEIIKSLTKQEDK